jgi:hypothetical protein
VNPNAFLYFRVGLIEDETLITGTPPFGELKSAAALAAWCWIGRASYYIKHHIDIVSNMGASQSTDGGGAASSPGQSKLVALSAIMEYQHQDLIAD